jgi:hypothetical protein
VGGETKTHACKARKLLAHAHRLLTDRLRFGVLALCVEHQCQIADDLATRVAKGGVSGRCPGIRPGDINETSSLMSSFLVNGRYRFGFSP